MSATPGARLPAPLLVFVLLAAVGTVFIAMWNGPDDTQPSADPERSVARDEPSAATLAVRGAEAPGTQPAGTEGARPNAKAGSAALDEAAADTTAEPTSRLLLFTAEAFRLLGQGEYPAAPGSVVDELGSAEERPLELPRAYVVGQPGAYGIRGDFGTTGSYTWQGLATLTHDARAPTEAEEDTKDPAKAAIRGSIVDAEGEAIPGAEVILYSSFYVRQAYYDHRVRQIGRVLADAKGVFEVRPVDLDTVHFGGNGEVLMTVRHARYADIVATRLRGIRPGQAIDIGRVLLPSRSAKLSGVIRNLKGEPVVGAAVRASGDMTPSDYDKTERMIVLDACPTAITDENGAYELTDFAAGEAVLSIHVNIDCVRHERRRLGGESTWSPRVLAGGEVRGRVVDGSGDPVAAAVVAGGGNWTPSNADGTFWLDNIQPGPLTIEVAHHLWYAVSVKDVATDGKEDIELVLETRLPRVTIQVVDEAGEPIPLVAIDWTWPKGQGPGLSTPDSRFWHDPKGVSEVIVPEGTEGATISIPEANRVGTIAPAELTDGAELRVVLREPAPVPDDK